MKDEILDEFEVTALIKVKPNEVTLPVDTSAEWTKGFMLVNKLIKELAEVRYKEAYIDSSGIRRERIVLHPQLLSYLQERRKLLDQIWKISGGEIINEGRKEMAKGLAKAIFEAQMDDKVKKKYEEKAKKIIEIEEFELNED